MESQQSKDILKKLLTINRKLHIHLGLFLLLFIWLFFISGLIIHHGEWKFASFYEKRIESKIDFVVPAALLNDNPDLVRQVEDQLKISGEVENLKIKPGSIDFRVFSPGLLQDIHIDSQTGNATMKVMKYNFWGKLRTLHLFNGMNKADPSKSPNWIITKFWRLTMDITAVILIILCLGSWVMWYKVRSEYRLGYIFFAFGCIVAGYYVFLLDLL